MQVTGVALHVDQPGENLPLQTALFDGVHGRDPIEGVQPFRQFMQVNDRSVVHGHLVGGPGLVSGGDLLTHGNEIHGSGRFRVSAHELVGFGGGLGIVKCHTGRNDIDQGKTLVGYRRLDQWHQLLLVTGKAAGDEGGAQLQRGSAEINGVKQTGVALFADGALIRSGGVLALGRLKISGCTLVENPKNAVITCNALCNSSITFVF